MKLKFNGHEFYSFYCRYGLLGASGCGKTTILSIIVGMRNLDKGEILVFGAKPGRGYLTDIF